jgi:hypothetical protein
MYRVGPKAEILYSNPLWLAMASTTMAEAPARVEDWNIIMTDRCYAQAIPKWLEFVHSDAERTVIEVEWRATGRWGELHCPSG